MKLKQLIKNIEVFYPQTLAEPWDKVGLQLGDEQKDIKNVLTALEITDEVIDEAEEKKIDLIIAHHPLIFTPIENLTKQNKGSNKILRLIKNDIAVYIMHTNIDVAHNGLNDWLCEIMDIKKTSILKHTKKFAVYNAIVETDLQNVDSIIALLPKIGVGIQQRDNYSYLMSPKVKKFKNYKTEDEKDIVVIEFFIKEDQIRDLKYNLKLFYKNLNIKTVLTLNLDENKATSYGIGRVGFIKPQTLDDLGHKISNNFNIQNIRLVGSREKIINKVAIVGGSGRNYILDAYKKGCDVLITGDIGFHDAREAIDLGICLIDASHYLEIAFNDGMATFLDFNDKISVFASEVDSNPFEVL